jgi:alkylated DNA repair dioxygenase AlkB
MYARDFVTIPAFGIYEPEAIAPRQAQIAAPRSAYLMHGRARSDWQHSIPEVEALRYSETFRTVR